MLKIMLLASSEDREEAANEVNTELKKLQQARKAKALAPAFSKITTYSFPGLQDLTDFNYQ